jgi:hypothetical protein
MTVTSSKATAAKNMINAGVRAMAIGIEEDAENWLFGS